MSRGSAWPWPICPRAGCHPVEILRLRCWLAGRTGDDAIERRTSQALVDEEPGNTAALDRLAELAVKAGRCYEADAYRKKQGGDG